MVDFNSAASTRMHVDINSCFATIEQQANPALRNKPVVVAAYTTPKGCILASSREAKSLGIKTGMMVLEGKRLYPKLTILTPDPDKYRTIHKRMKSLLLEFSDKTYAGSIDEFNLNLKDYPILKRYTPLEVGGIIKRRIKEEIGEWITVSIGIAPNKYLAKIAANLQKPNGLSEINSHNFREIYLSLKLTDLTGIKSRNASRLASSGIYSVLDLYKAPVWKLKAAFHSVTGLYWHLRLSGFEIDDVEFARRSFGNSVALGVNLATVNEVIPIASNLTYKMCERMRAASYSTCGIHLALFYKNGSFWHKGVSLSHPLFDSRDIFKIVSRLLFISPTGTKGKIPVRNIAVTCFDLKKDEPLQMDFFEDISKKETLTKTIDKINKNWGNFVIKPGRILLAQQKVLDRIAFGGVREFEL